MFFFEVYLHKSEDNFVTLIVSWLVPCKCFRHQAKSKKNIKQTVKLQNAKNPPRFTYFVKAIQSKATRLKISGHGI
jgi:hypothetical protein